MLFAYLSLEPVRLPLTDADVIGAAVTILLPMAILAAILFKASSNHRGAKPVLTALALGAVLGMLLGSIYVFWHWFSWFPGNQGILQLIEDTAAECIWHRSAFLVSGCLGMGASWLSLMIFGKRTNKTDSG
jgi:hypothetical protein